MAVHESGHVVHALGVEQRLLIGEAFTHLLNATMNIARHNIYLLHHLTIDRCTIAHHTMGRGVLRANVDDIFIGTKHLFIHTLCFAILIFDKGKGVVFIFFGCETQWVGRVAIVIVFAQGIAHPVGAQEKTAHVGVIDKHNAKEVINFTFLKVGNRPNIAHGVQARCFAIGSSHLHMNHFMSFRIGQVIHATQRLFPVNAHQCAQHIEMELLFQGFGK
ncbi:Uncharacterised protein [Chlamydia trachomatis]|nr:Uncharacterised protein [Chlamydia trachomatis]